MSTMHTTHIRIDSEVAGSLKDISQRCNRSVSDIISILLTGERLSDSLIEELSIPKRVLKFEREKLRVDRERRYLSTEINISRNVFEFVIVALNTNHGGRLNLRSLVENVSMNYDFCKKMGWKKACTDLRELRIVLNKVRWNSDIRKVREELHKMLDKDHELRSIAVHKIMQGRMKRINGPRLSIRESLLREM